MCHDRDAPTREKASSETRLANGYLDAATGSSGYKLTAEDQAKMSQIASVALLAALSTWT